MRETAALLPPLAIIDCYRRWRGREQEIFPAEHVRADRGQLAEGDVWMTARPAALRLRMRASPMAMPHTVHIGGKARNERLHGAELAIARLRICEHQKGQRRIEQQRDRDEHHEHQIAVRFRVGSHPVDHATCCQQHGEDDQVRNEIEQEIDHDVEMETFFYECPLAG